MYRDLAALISLVSFCGRAGFCVSIPVPWLEPRVPMDPTGLSPGSPQRIFGSISGVIILSSLSFRMMCIQLPLAGYRRTPAAIDITNNRTVVDLNETFIACLQCFIRLDNVDCTPPDLHVKMIQGHYSHCHQHLVLMQSVFSQDHPFLFQHTSCHSPSEKCPNCPNVSQSVSYISIICYRRRVS